MKHAQSEPNSKFEEIDTLRNPFGLVAVITRTCATHQLSVAFYKEFDRGGEVRRTTFVQRRHLDRYGEFVKVVMARMDELEDIDRAMARLGHGESKRST